MHKKLNSSRKEYTEKFGRLFPKLKAFAKDNAETRKQLYKIAQNMYQHKGNSNIPAGFTYLGQFIHHDISFDNRTLQDSYGDSDTWTNHRSSHIDLDSIYGGGPEVSPFLYDRNRHKGRTHFLVETIRNEDNEYLFDVPRNSQGTATIADPRNDENLIISQLHVLFLRFHNSIADKLAYEFGWKEDRLFQEAYKVVKYHYHAIVLYDYLPRIVKREEIDRCIINPEQGRIYTWKRSPFIPIECSAAIFRFGHSMVRTAYAVNKKGLMRLFKGSGQDLRSGRIANIPIDWKYFFWTENGHNRAHEISPHLSFGLRSIPFPAVFGETDLAYRNLLRGLIMGLPSGQDVAKELNLPPLEVPTLSSQKMNENTPLWYYILFEAWQRGRAGKLGEMGERLVAETLIGLLQNDATSLVNLPDWRNWKSPLTNKREFTMVDLLAFVDNRQDS